MYKLIFAKNFKEDVKRSADYIKHTLQSPLASERLMTEIKRVYKIIKETPFIYPIVPNDYWISILNNAKISHRGDESVACLPLSTG